MLIVVLMWGVVIGTGLAAAISRCKRDGSTVALLLLICSICLAVRVTPAGFYGLEYEDAYVYAAAGKFESSRSDQPSSSRWTISVCSVGSLIQCEQTEDYPGHLTAYPTLVRAVLPITGAEPHVFPMIGAFLASIAALGVWWAALALTESRVGAAGAALLYATTPALALYGGSAVSETASSAVLAIWCGATLEAAVAQIGRRAALWWLASITAAVLAALTRRENLILIPITAVCVLLSSLGTLGRRARLSIVAAIMISTIPLVAVAGRSLLSEIGEYGEFSFSMWRLVDTAPTVLAALASPTYYVGTVCLAAFGVCVLLRKVILGGRRSLDVVGLGLAAVSAIWILSYAAHVRSTYQLGGIPPEPFDFLRYLSNAGVPIAILASVALAAISRRSQVVAQVGIGVSVVVGCVFSLSLRSEVENAEWRSRIEPARIAIDTAVALGGLPLVTLEPLVAQLQGPSSLFVVSLPSLDREVVQRLGDDLLYLEHDAYRNDVDLERYAVGFESLPTQRQVVREGAGWRLWRLKNDTASDGLTQARDAQPYATEHVARRGQSEIADLAGHRPFGPASREVEPTMGRVTEKCLREDLSPLLRAHAGSNAQ